MDERLSAGRHHLQNGDRALQTGYPDDARAHFESALLQFRGPELRLGEAHALRGLGQVELHTGDIVAAEAHLRAALEGYQSLNALIERIDVDNLSHELRRDGSEGEASALTLLGELLLRVGRTDEARTTLAYAREIYGRLGDVPSGAAAWTAQARFAMHDGRYDGAQEAFDHALAIHTRSANLAGQAGIWLSIAEPRRIQRDLAGAEEAHGKARALAQQARNPMLEGRALASLGGLLLQQQRLPEARAAFSEALPLARRAGDPELEGSSYVGLGDVMSRMDEGFGLDELVRGAKLLAEVEYQHGLANAMLRIGEHALRIAAPELALAASEGARRIYRRTDPVHGVGLAYRVMVKALSALQEYEGVLAAAVAREAVAGAQQPNAREVAAFYRQRAPEGWVEALKPLGAKGIIERTEQIVAKTLTSPLWDVGVGPEALESATGCLFVVEGLANRLPRPAPPEEWERPNAAPADDLEEDPRTEELAVERIFAESPPDEEPMVLIHSPAVGEPAALFLGSSGAVAVPDAPVADYEGAYDPPTGEAPLPEKAPE